MQKRMAGRAEVARGLVERCMCGDRAENARTFVPQFTLQFSLFSLLISVLKQSS